MTHVPALDALLVAIGVVLLSWLLLLAFLWLHRPSREAVGPALRIIPDLVRLVRALLADRSTPWSFRLALVGLLAYLLSPIDLVPDFLPGIGSLDDVIIVAAVLRWSGRRIGVESLESHWRGDPSGFALLRRLLGL
jgi:uncharacterized membrane protein YkvA (DUF1232 family)